ncbi:MAG: hypothetical protein JWM88_3067 [Verrucomicrobia bacterium]|nr:hypothetical protein [Verrucomicrobiota bacterium]
MSPIATAPAHPLNDERWTRILFLAAWLANFAFALVGWENTLINQFEFRQAQTALTTAYLPPGHLPLAYETPVFGPPWSVPLEFPLYEASVSTFAAVTGMPLDPAGRFVSWIYFQLSLPAFFLVLGSLRIRASARFLCLSLLLTSPLYLFFSRAFLIESTALCFCAWFLAAFARWLTTGRPGWFWLAGLAGALGAAVKLTTVVVFAIAALLFAFGAWRERLTLPALAGARRSRFIFRTVAAFLLPVAAGLAWLMFSTTVRNRNSNADILNTHFGFWSFGDLAQRISPGYWTRTVAVWTKGLISEAGLALGLYLFIRQRGRGRWLALGLFGAFLSGQMVFSNLYKVHDYYFYESGVFLAFALGVLLAGNEDDPALPRWGRIALPVVVMLLQLANYARNYLPDQRTSQPSTELIDALQDLTRPNDIIVFQGLDWDATVPYYAGRRALMFVNGREWDRRGMKQSVDRLDPAQVGAVVIVAGLWRNTEFINQTMAHLDLGSTPLLVNDGDQVGLWFPKSRHAFVRDHLPSHPYPHLEVIEPRPAPDVPHVLGLREISHRREFSAFRPLPFEASSPADFSGSMLGPEMILNAHAPSEMRFRIPERARSVFVNFGVHDGAYTGKNRTDGVEFVLACRTPGKPETIFYRRLLDPIAHVKDQGTQSIELPLGDSRSGEMVFRTLPGPNNNFSFDWAYWGKIEFR